MATIARSQMSDMLKLTNNKVETFEFDEKLWHQLFGATRGSFKFDTSKLKEQDTINMFLSVFGNIVIEPEKDNRPIRRLSGIDGDYDGDDLERYIEYDRWMRKHGYR